MRVPWWHQYNASAGVVAVAALQADARCSADAVIPLDFGGGIRYIVHWRSEVKRGGAFAFGSKKNPLSKK